MNYKLKKVTLLLMVLLLTISCAACQKAEGKTEQKTEESQGTAGEGTTERADKYAQQREISLAVIDNVTEEEWGNDFHQFFQEKFNIKWDYNYVEWGSWAEKMRVWINSGDLPDVAIWDYNYTDAASYVEQELLYRFPDDWKERWPNAAFAFDSSPLNKELEEKFGGTYVMLRPIYVNNKPSDPIVNQIGVIALRKDWAEAVGFELKDAYTIEETMEYARLVKEQDPGKVGSSLIPLCYDPANAMTCFVSASSSHARLETAFYKAEDGTYHWGPGEAETLEALKVYQQAYKEGLLDKEFYLMNDDDKDKFYINGTAALYAMGGVADFRQTCDVEMKNNLQLNSDDVVHTAIVLGNDEKYHNIVLGANYWSSLLFSPDISDENFERIMDMIDYTCTKEGQLVCNMGFVGVDWEYDENNEPRSLLTGDVSVRDKYGARIESIYILEDDFSIVNPAIKKEYRERMLSHAKDKAAYGEGMYSEYDWDKEFHTSKAKEQAFIEYEKEYANLIVQEGDLETNWRKWIDSKKTLVEPYLAELNALK